MAVEKMPHAAIRCWPKKNTTLATSLEANANTLSQAASFKNQPRHSATCSRPGLTRTASGATAPAIDLGCLLSTTATKNTYDTHTGRTRHCNCNCTTGHLTRKCNCHLSQVYSMASRYNSTYPDPAPEYCLSRCYRKSLQLFGPLHCRR